MRWYLVTAVAAVASGCVADDARVFNNSEFRVGEIPDGTIGALDTQSVSVQAFRFTTTSHGESDELDVTATFVAGKVFIPLEPVFGVDAQGAFDIDVRGFATRPDDGAVPNLLMLLHSMPGEEIGLGSTFTASRPTDAEAEGADKLVFQLQRYFTVIDAWDTPEGLVVRVQGEGYNRWYPNGSAPAELFPEGLDSDPAPEHYGYVDVNLSTGQVIDALYYAGVGLGVETPADIPNHPDAKELRLCPAPGASFAGMADTCS